ncbi:S1 RNA-binding domain-containing protein [Aquibacillus albus]|uniref:RNA-binding protein (Virulence factor B family) n=1 Tax=Aquibacillus albus TaxID=1168171 RepID=A0ABS2N2J0_9BACI|nr:S1-like domain-containing RNA-binding protein [Aquibacillus albus]MBM7572311.1 putative RNA-binding protein (virulence factor B family) [Aquibacillus albus]
MNNWKVGTVHNLKVERKIDTGFVLTNGTEEVLLHKREANEELNAEDEVTVFLYHDKQGKMVATMSIPSIGFDTFDWAEVVEVVKGLGVFVNIGIDKEILVSNDDLPLLESVWPQVGDMLYVALSTDKKGRLTAEPVTEGDFANNWDAAPPSLMNNTVGGRVFRTSKEGAVMITEEGYRGFIHNTERKKEPRLGEWVNGRVIKVKEDGTLNLSLRPFKREGRLEDAEVILHFLKDNQGVMDLNDRSTPEDIYNTFRISKAAFKRAIGKLMKENKVEQKGGKTYLTNTN